MSEQYTVKQGDTMLSIAAVKGFTSWEVIWADAGNAELRKKRDPQVLSPGDTITIPDKKERAYVIQTNRIHTFTVKSVKAWFRTTVLDEYGKPLANCRFTLDVGGKSQGGYTDGGGQIELQVDPKPHDGELTVYLNTQPERKLTFKLKLGHLDPIDKLSGVKARLTNLGFAAGKIDESKSEELAAALRNFQIVRRLPVTGEADEATRSLLVELHDRR